VGSAEVTGTVDRPFDLTGRVAVVTGARRGLGRAIALALARAGADVGVGLRDAENDGGAVAEIEALGRRAVPLSMDVLDVETSLAALDTAAEALGGLDVLVNNAGGGIPSAPAAEVSLDDFDHVWALNVRSAFALSQHAAKRMRSGGGGAIVNMASQAGLVALPGESAYCIAKAAVVHMTRCHAVEWGVDGIRVNAVAPTFIETDGTQAALGDPDFRADTVERIAALHRIGVPREVADAVVFLAAPAASLITGQTLAIDGGWTAR
jgi:NAD(P)-dependent dehydrogenase (short-subunit alcohol dehydrogenase family)